MRINAVQNKCSNDTSNEFGNYISYYKSFSRKQYEDALGHLIEETKKGNLYGSWDDYGRLSDY